MTVLGVKLLFQARAVRLRERVKVTALRSLGWSAGLLSEPVYVRRGLESTVPHEHNGYRV